MPKFYFDIADADPSIPCEGANLPSLAAARCHALQYAGQILCDQKPPFWDADEWVLTVSDAQHLILFTLTIATSDAPSTMRDSPPAYALTSSQRAR
jgi:hypothetical protein